MRAAQSLRRAPNGGLSRPNRSRAELAESARRLATPLAKTALESAAAEPDDMGSNAAKLLGCEGGDLNPYASYGASTSRWREACSFSRNPEKNAGSQYAEMRPNSPFGGHWGTAHAACAGHESRS
jgi:hypothetical protein